MQNNLKQELNAAISAALTAGHFLADNRHAPLEHRQASARDIKLKADQDSEAIILEMLERLAPHPFLAEESGGVEDLPESDPIWIIDPLDGTVNYSRGLDLCCVSVALCKGLKPLLGVIYDFSRNELFSATENQGAFLNGHRINASKTVDPSKAILATGFPVNRSFDAEPLKNFLNQVQHFRKLRLFGSAALSLAYTACSRVDAYMEEDIMYYDVAAGMAIAREAGAWTSLIPTPTKTWSMIARAGHVWKHYQEIEKQL